VTFLARIRKRYTPEPTRFSHEEPNSLDALHEDGRKAKARIDDTTFNQRDALLERLLTHSYPEERSQDC
jgi:hypothetical protein